MLVQNIPGDIPGTGGVPRSVSLVMSRFYSRTLIADFARCMARGGRRAPELLTEGDASGMHGAECFVPYLSLTPVSNLCWRACCAEYFSRTAPGRWSVIADFAATSWGVGARACVMKIGSLFRYGYPCRAMCAPVHGLMHGLTWGDSLCLDLFTGANEPWGTVFGHARVSRVHMQDCCFAHIFSRILMPINAMLLGEMAILCPVA